MKWVTSIDGDVIINIDNIEAFYYEAHEEKWRIKAATISSEEYIIDSVDTEEEAIEAIANIVGADNIVE
jgi:hypothetical protein